MALKRMSSLSKKVYAKYRERQLSGTMTEIYDNEGYLCYDEDEVKNYKPRKRGRPPIKVKVKKDVNNSTTDILIDLAKRIDSIEERDPNFTQNVNWKELKKKQEYYHIKLAEEKLEYYENDYKARPLDYTLQKINFYKNYIEKNKK